MPPSGNGKKLLIAVSNLAVHAAESSNSAGRHAVTMADAHGSTDADKGVSQFVHSSPKLGMAILA